MSKKRRNWIVTLKCVVHKLEIDQVDWEFLSIEPNE